MSAGTPRVSEFDRFGPWIDEVTEPDDVPRLFRDHGTDLQAARLVLKVPRNIARRDATPDMDLYDHLLVLDADRLTVLSRRAARVGGVGIGRGAPAPEGYDVVTAPLAEVVAVRDSVSMLDGRLSVHTYDGTVVSFRYNGAGRANITRLVSGMRAAAAGREPSAVGRALVAAARSGDVGGEPGLVRLDVGPDDLALASDARDLMRANPALQLWACHGRAPLAPSAVGAAGLLRRLVLGVSPMTLHGAVVAADDVAVEVVGRHEWLIRGRAPVHSTSRLVLPLSAPDRVDVTPHPRYAWVAVVRVSGGRSAVELVLPVASAACRVLAAAATAGALTGW